MPSVSAARDRASGGTRWRRRRRVRGREGPDSVASRKNSSVSKSHPTTAARGEGMRADRQRWSPGKPSRSSRAERRCSTPAAGPRGCGSRRRRSARRRARGLEPRRGTTRRSRRARGRGRVVPLLRAPTLAESRLRGHRMLALALAEVSNAIFLQRTGCVSAFAVTCCALRSEVCDGASSKAAAVGARDEHMGWCT